MVTGQRSDVVQLWRVTPSTKQIQILSIPRDTVVSMLPPDTAQFGTYNRINSSYNSGADQLVKTITANFGIPINHVVQVDFAGFQDAVNALGRHLPRLPLPGQGLLLGPRHHHARLPAARTVRRPSPWPGPATTSTTPTGIGSTTGRAISAGSSARTCSSESLITAAKSKVNPLTVNAFIGSIHEGIAIDDGFGINELIGLALDYRSFDPSQPQTQTLPTERRPVSAPR